MRAIKIAFTLFFLALGSTCKGQNKYVTRSYCAEHNERFGPVAQRDLKSKFSTGKQNMAEYLRANKPHKKALQDPAYKKLIKASDDFDAKTDKLYEVAEKGNVKQLTAYCEYLVELYNWLHNDQQCGNQNKELFGKVCQPCAAYIQTLFEGDSAHKKFEAKGKVANHPSFNAGHAKESHGDRNKYAHMKKKSNKNKKIEMPEEKKSEVVIHHETPREEVHHASPVLTDEERRVVHDTFYEPEAEVVVEAKPQAPLKRKRVIVVEVLACKGCNKDAFLKQYVVEHK